MEQENAIVRQFGLQNAWNRLGRLVVAEIAAMTALGHQPSGYMEWLGLAGVAAAALWTSEART